MAKRALLIGVTDAYSPDRLRPRPSVAAMEELLCKLGGWTTTVLEGVVATREAMLAALRRLAAEVEAGDDVLVYFFGHGGVVRFDGKGPLSRRPFFYLAAARPDRQTSLTGVFDFELSPLFAEIDRKCENVSAILDCCHAANIVRAGSRAIAPPAWLEALMPIPAPNDELLAEEGHPRVLRLAGTSSWRSGFAAQTIDGHLGYLTRGFVEVIREAEWQLDRLTWDAVAHRVREHAIQARGSEIQWVTLAGPRQRLVFSREVVELPRTVGFVSDAEPGSGWLRAGLLQAVEVGDLWDLAALRLDSARRPVALVRARVVEVDLNRARVELVGDEWGPPPPDGSSAMLVSTRTKAEVSIAGSPSLEPAIGESALLRSSSSSSAFASAAALETGVVVERRRAEPLTVTVGDTDSARELLEDWVRADRLVRLVGSGRAPVAEPDIGWGRYRPSPGGIGLRHELPTDGSAVVHVGDRLYFEISHRRPQPESWFVSVIEIGVGGRPTLTTTNEPDGVEIPRGRTICIGCRDSVAGKGVLVDWPAAVPRDRPRTVAVMLLASRRPMQLGHIVRLADRHAHLLELAPRSSTGGTRGQNGRSAHSIPKLSRSWGSREIRYLLVPDRRSPAG